MQTTRIQAGLGFLVANTISLLFFNVVRPHLILELVESNLGEENLTITI
jgi:hypothetical protein